MVSQYLCESISFLKPRNSLTKQEYSLNNRCCNNIQDASSIQLANITPIRDAVLCYYTITNIKATVVTCV